MSGLSLPGVYIEPLTLHSDPRGWLAELWRDDELPDGLRPVMGYVSETLPGVTRGPHMHYRQTDVFAFVGPGELAVWLWDVRPGPTWGREMRLTAGASRPLRLIVPPGVVHAYRNCGDGPAWVLNFPDALYRGPGRSEAVDELRLER